MIHNTFRRGILCLLAALLILTPACRKVAPASPKPSQSGTAGPAETEPAASGTDEPAETEVSPAQDGPGDDGVWLPTEPADEEGIPDDGILYVKYVVNYEPAGKITNGGLRKLNGQAQEVERSRTSATASCAGPTA